MKNILILLLVISFFAQPCYAYIDPFTGGFILQAITALFATIVFYLGYPIRIFKKIYNKFFKKKIK